MSGYLLTIQATVSLLKKHSCINRIIKATEGSRCVYKYIFVVFAESICWLVNRLTLVGVIERSQYFGNIVRHLLITGMGPQVARVERLSWAESRSSTLVRVTRWTANSCDDTQCPGGLPSGGVQGRRNHAVVHSCNRQLQRSYKGMSISSQSPCKKPYSSVIITRCPLSLKL